MDWPSAGRTRVVAGWVEGRRADDTSPRESCRTLLSHGGVEQGPGFASDCGDNHYTYLFSALGPLYKNRKLLEWGENPHS